MTRFRSGEKRRPAVRQVVAGLFAAFFAAAASPAAAALTEGARLAAVYGTILDARFHEVEDQLKRTCPPAPVEACHTLRVVSAWWEIQINPENRKLDDRFNELAQISIAASQAWTRREPQRAEAWFYLAASHGPLVQWRVLRGERLAAAREGKRIKEALERALELDPALHDAYFGIGLYHYYADVAPAAFKILRFVLLLPGGDRARGLAEMLTARDRGEVLKSEASYQLQQVYLWYERQPEDALEILQQLDAQYSHNPLFLGKVAEVRDAYFKDHPGSAAAWQTLIDRAQADKVHDPARAEMRARIGLAKQLDALFETDRAIDELKTVLAARADTLSADARARAAAMLTAAQQRMSQDAYRLSLEGWRAFERGAAGEAESALKRAIERAPSDPVARYRYARVLEQAGDAARVREELDKVLAAPHAPAFVRSSALVISARLIEQEDGDRALQMYQQALDVAGGDLRARDDARRAIRRLQPSTKK